MLWKQLIALAQVKPVNTSENLLNQIGEINYFLFQTKKSNNIINSIKLDIIFMNSKNSKVSEPYRLLIKVKDKVN